MNSASKVRKIAFVSDHLPRKCGIATFTSDLLAAVASAHPQSQCLAVSVNDIPGGYEYPEVVRFEIEEQDLSSYVRAADFLNISNVDIVCLQHEFAIFGGPVGGHILALLRELRMPVVTTLHTVLREPKADQRRVMKEVITLSTRLVVMAERGRQMLEQIYQAPPAKIDLIPHGIPAQITSGTLAYAFGAGKAVVSTPYWHAAELLAEERGVLVPFGDAAAITREVTALLRDDTRRHAIRKNAYRIGREMIWSNVTQMYMRSFECSRLEGAVGMRRFLATKTLDQKARELPPMKLSHLSRMTDSTGVFQHAVFSVPNFSEGYCTDDNARAFILAALLGELGEDPVKHRRLPGRVSARRSGGTNTRNAPSTGQLVEVGARAAAAVDFIAANGPEVALLGHLQLRQPAQGFESPLVHRLERSRARTLFFRDRRLPRWLARRSRQRQPGSGIDPGLLAFVGGNAISAKHIGQF
jgi:hypothetical protein